MADDKLQIIAERLARLEASSEGLSARMDRFMDFMNPRIEKWDGTSTKVDMALGIAAGAWAALIGAFFWLLDKMKAGGHGS